MKLRILGFIVCSFIVFCTETKAENNSCKVLSKFFPYKAGVALEKKGKHNNAFDIYCHLAIQGDYRAQFKIAQYFQTGIEGKLEASSVHAIVWAKFANYYIKSRKRADFISSVEQNLSEEQLAIASERFSFMVSMMPGGRRIDMQYKPIDIAELIKEKKKKRKFTGSNIKKDKAPINLGIINF